MQALCRVSVVPLRSFRQPTETPIWKLGAALLRTLHREGGITVDANERLSSTSPTPGQILNRNRSAATGKRDVNLYSMATNQTAILARFA
jgi:hypothetical protein